MGYNIIGEPLNPKEKAVMKLNKVWLALFIFPLLLIGCSGQDAGPTTQPTELTNVESTIPVSPTDSSTMPTATPVPDVEFYEVVTHFELGSPHDVFVAGDFAFIADSFSGLRIVDLSDLANPVEVSAFDPGGSTMGNGVAFSAPYAYLADGMGVRILDVADPTTPTEVGFYDSIGFSLDLQVSDGYAFVADREGGLMIADFSIPTEPIHVANYFKAGSVHVLDVIVSGSYVYVAMGGEGLRIVDITDLENPQEVGFYDTEGVAEAVGISGSYAYLADGGDGLRIFDISDPSVPQEVGFYDTPGYAKDVFVDGDLVYLGDGTSSLVLILDVSDPTNPQLIAEHKTPGYVWGLVVAHSHIFIANGEHGFMILRMEFN
jgi:hypothetical protein